MEQAKKVFDGMLGVSGWATLSRGHRPTEIRDPRLPWWWEDENEASDSFLNSMGVSL